MSARLEELAERDADGTLTEAEANELRTLLAQGPARTDLVWQRRLALLVAASGGRSATTVARMALAVQEDVLDRSPSSAQHMAHAAMAHARTPATVWSRWRVAAAAAVLLAVAAVGGATLVRKPPPGCELVTAHGAVTLNGRVAIVGARITAGDTIGLGDAAQASLRADDGSVFELAGGSRLQLASGPGTTLRLIQGAINGDIRHQPPGAPLRILGPRSVCTVIGTRLTFSVAGDHDRLSVIEGLVHAERPSDHLAVDIPAGQTVDIAASGSLLPRPSAGGSPADPVPGSAKRGSSLYNPNEAYDVSLPPFPVTYSAAQKQAQHLAGIALVTEVKEALHAGKTEYRAKPGVYRLPKGADFDFGGAGDFALHLPDCELVLESVEDRCLFKFGRAKSFTLTGPLKIDCDPLAETQGRIIADDSTLRQFTVEIMPGYHALAVGKKEKEFLHAFTPQGIWLPNPAYPEFAWKDATLSANGRSMTVRMSKDIKREYWERLYQAGNLVTVGNAGCGVLFCIWPDQLGELTVEDMDFYGGGFAWGNATGNSTLRRVRGLRRPGTNRLAGGGGWQSGKRQGTVLFDSCEFRTTNDDILDLSSGSMDMVWKQESPRTCVVWTWSGHRYDQDPAGSAFSFYRRDFTPIAAAQLAAVAQRIPDDQAKPWLEPAAQLVKSKLDFKAFTDGRAFWRLTFDRDLAVEPGTLVEDIANRQMEVVMRNCTWYDCGMRAMIQSGRKVELTNNHFVRVAAGLQVCTDSWWWQGETVHDVLIADNVFISTSYGDMWNSGKAAISVHNGTKPIADFPGRYPHTNIVIRDNLIQGAGSGAIIVQNSSGVRITGNECRDLFRDKEAKDGAAGISISGCGKVVVTGNRIGGCPAPAISADWIDGLDLSGNVCTAVGTVAKPVPGVVLDHVRAATVTGNHADHAHLEALIRVGNSAGVDLTGNAIDDAPGIPPVVEGAGNSAVRGAH